MELINNHGMLVAMSFLDRFFKQSFEKDLKEAKQIITAINAFEPVLIDLKPVELKTKTTEFKKRLQSGETLDDILPEAFAVVRETAKRTLGERHYDVQLVGGYIMHKGNIAEMRTGEGKTLVGTLPAYLNALSGKGVHVVTVNDYLAQRDSVWMGQVYAALGMSVGVINHNTSYLYDAEARAEGSPADETRDELGSYKIVHDFLRPCSRHEAYNADITYGTNNEFGFDYLRDNIEFEASKIRQKQHTFAIVDEIDSILIDEARTPLIISAPVTDTENLYEVFTRVAARLNKDEHFIVDEKLKVATLNDAGIEAAEKMLGIDNIYTDKGIKYVHHLETAVRAKSLYTRDKEYVVRDGEVVIVDEFTGRMQPGRRWSDGLHQAVEAKEGVKVQQESRTYASVTYQNYFRLYEKLTGMTGTALTSQEEFFSVYGLDVVPIPTHRQVQRIDRNDKIFQTEKGKFEAIIRKVKAVSETGQPILIGTASIDKNEELSVALTKAGVKHEMLNAKNHEREAEIIAAAGRIGAVTLATNMAGRGVDIKLGGVEATKEEAEAVKRLGGLFVLGTERHEARRIDNQLRGRSGRQGDPGETEFYVSMEDSLMRVFGGDRVKRLMGTFGIPEDQPIENRMISKQLESAQTRIEGFHFDARKQVLAYDDVLNKQRQIIYNRRRKLLVGDRKDIDAAIEEIIKLDPDTLAAAVDVKKAELGDERWYEVARKLILQMTDIVWVEHLEVMNYTRSSVNLRAYGQRNPLTEYQKEGTRLFAEMQAATKERVAEIIPHLKPEAVEKEEESLRKEREAAKRAGGSTTIVNKEVAQEQRINTNTYGRNDLVSIKKGEETKQLKFKKAELLVANDGWTIVRTPLK